VHRVCDGVPHCVRGYLVCGEKGGIWCRQGDSGNEWRRCTPTAVNARCLLGSRAWVWSRVWSSPACVTWGCALPLQACGGRVHLHLQSLAANVAVINRLDNTTSRKGLNAQQAAFANRRYKSHRRVGLPGDIIQDLADQDG